MRQMLKTMEPMLKEHKVSDKAIETFMEATRKFRQDLGGVDSRIKAFGDVVKNTTSRTAVRIFINEIYSSTSFLLIKFIHLLHLY